MWIVSDLTMVKMKPSASPMMTRVLRTRVKGLAAPATPATKTIRRVSGDYLLTGASPGKPL